MNFKKVSALLLCCALGMSAATGCGSINKDAVVATLDGEEVTLGLANFMARLTQASYDDMYISYFGEDVWSQDSSTMDGTMEDSLKASVLDTLREYVTLRAHMDEYGVTITDDEMSIIEEAAETFISDNSDEAIEALGADLELVEEYLSLRVIDDKMYDAIIADADTEVSDEEANTSAYSYVRLSTSTYTDDDGNTVEHTDETLEELENTLLAFSAEASVNGMEEAAERYGYDVASSTYNANTQSIDDAVRDVLDGLDEGEVSGVIQTDSYFYVVRLDARTDEDATELVRQSMVSDLQSSYYDEVLEGWEDEQEWDVNARVWKKVRFDNLFTLTAPDTE